MRPPPGFPPVITASESRKDHERISVMYIGRSTKPVKRFFETCREYADKQAIPWSRSAGAGLPVRDQGAETEPKPQDGIFRRAGQAEPRRGHLELQYRDPETQRYYTRGGIPYRRGYILHRLPCKSKASLSLLHVRPQPLHAEDAERQWRHSSSRALPKAAAYCIVLVEDMDAVGMKRKTGGEEEGKENKLIKLRMPDPDVIAPGCTLSGLLNVLDVASREGRIILMTPNLSEKLSETLLRPGLIDRKLYLGHIDASAAEQMFCRIFEPDPPEHPVVADDDRQLREREELDKAALRYAAQIRTCRYAGAAAEVPAPAPRFRSTGR
ncbi:hypothetical protein DL765_001697 [Monosporascus sp. GIB2]|nr:hypothetical protein DL765_001697 [Monosporascus sp. GIB2]